MEGIIYIVGIGPGNPAMMTEQARSCLKESEVIVGYTVYADLLKGAFPEKEYVTTPMRQEIDRCKLCYEYAAQGRSVSLVCSGDAGVYGMAAPMYELSEAYPDIRLVVVPGVTAASSGAALLGAPLGHDFCVISLSDLLTPWDAIEKRLKAAVQGDVAIAVSNPASHKRPDHLRRACEVLLAAGAEGTRPCGYVENIGREGERWQVCTLEELKETKVNMFTTVFIGNSQSVLCGGKLVTKRGYRV